MISIKPIPEGYTYTRCDIYTKDDFLDKYKSNKNFADVLKYVEENDKNEYNVDDEIAIQNIWDSRIVRSLGKASSKLYYYASDEQGYYDRMKKMLEE